MGYVAVKILFPGFTGGVKVQKTFSAFDLEAGENLLVMHGGEGDPIVTCG